jgi:hypothetical protein
VLGSRRLTVHNTKEKSDGEIRFDSEVDVSEVPEVHDKTEAYCINCAWHGRFDMLKKPKP